MNVKHISILVALAACMLMASVAMAVQGYGLSWWTVDGGGGESSGGSYALHGTIGQPDAGSPLSGGDYTLTGGFWAGAGPSGFDVYLSLVTR